MKKNWKQDLWVEVRQGSNGQWLASVRDQQHISSAATTMQRAIDEVVTQYASRKPQKRKR